MVGFASTASLVSGMALICFVRFNPSRRKLLPRQITSLAAAGILTNLADMPLVWADFSEDLMTSTKLPICYTFFSASRMFRLVVLMMEAHIALGLLSQMSHWTWMLPALSKSIPAMWGLGVLLGALFVLFSPNPSFSAADGCVMPRRDHMTVIVMLLCLLLSISACLSAAIKTCRSTAPHGVRMRFLRRTTCFPLVSVLSWVMIILVYLDHDLYTAPSWFFPVACIMELSNPLMNAVAYLVGSSFSNFSNRRDETAVQPFSFRVDFANAQVINIDSLWEKDLRKCLSEGEPEGGAPEIECIS